MTAAFPIPHGHISLGDAFDRAFMRLEDVEWLGRETARWEQIAPGLRGPPRAALARQEEALERVEKAMREALLAGDLTALCYRPDGREWGAIPMRTGWAWRSFFPGLDTFLDPAEGGVGESPIFLEVRAFEHWLENAARSSGPAVETGRRGRPTVMPLILADHRRGRAEGAFEGMSQKAVALELRALFVREHGAARAPQASAIEKALRRHRRKIRKK